MPSLAEGECMSFLVAHWRYLLEAWFLVTAALVVLMVYRGTLSNRENDELLLEKEEKVMMGEEQRSLLRKLNRLRPFIVIGATLSLALLVTGYITWIWAIVHVR